MLDVLKFVQGAVQRNGVTPELEHFLIRDGRVTGFNGYMALSGPLPLDIEAMPKADTFHKALQACGETVSITQTPSGKLHIRSGGFSAYVPCIEKTIFEAEPQGQAYPAPPGLAKTFARMLPFIGDDASRPWAMGLAIGQGAYTATNNVILMQVWDGHALPAVNCPRFAVAEVARIKDDPVEVMVDPGNSISFLYSDGRWLRTQVLAVDWPTDKMNSILERPSAPDALPDGFFEGVAQLAPFVAEKASSAVYFTASGMATGQEGSEEGATYRLAGLPAGEAFRHKALLMLAGEIDRIDFTVTPALFFGKNSRGALIGMQM
jgi:hypothetical protein